MSADVSGLIKITLNIFLAHRFFRSSLPWIVGRTVGVLVVALHVPSPRQALTQTHREATFSLKCKGKCKKKRKKKKD